MRRILIAAAAVLVIGPTAANATWKPFFFDCGGKKIVETGVIRNHHSDRPLTFYVTIRGIDDIRGMDDPAKIETPVFRWDQVTDEATFGDRHCRLLTDEEVENLEEDD
jgi:hypothetical protein